MRALRLVLAAGIAVALTTPAAYAAHSAGSTLLSRAVLPAGAYQPGPDGMPANLTRVVVQGSTSVPHQWLRLTVDPAGPGVFRVRERHLRLRCQYAVPPCPGPLAP